MSTNVIPLAGVIGSPIAHSKSPRLHGYWLKKYGIPGHYVPLHVNSDDLEDVLKTMPRMGFVGANVTIPHKEHVLTFADVVTDRAALIGAANTLIFREDGKLLADNTDGYGFIENLRQGVPGWSADAGPAAVIGAGGAARAVVSALIEVGCPEIRLANRTKARSEALRQEFGTKIQVIDWVQAGNMLEGAALVVNTSSLGMEGKAEMRIPLDGISPDAVVTDLVYTPLETKLLAHARSIGCRTVDGLGMLLYQAVPGFERWFGTRPEVDDALRETMLK
ncbi:shikimate dehydrogenase [Alphaproteobacteria bacterium GH1-50]|uniref:Shikimate dehydrogenase (NADP(+)) n=1 Tax=Kangsaoukella pontilimi TaxID=2691042 RepID=A0A7C9IGB6_9RHOB|nr:shikimate dehydrogenase [Kangsaoukella pontilimi]MXQ08244.1 shikimate dehydrogenase [Kangsaoukella pontilimi]